MRVLQLMSCTRHLSSSSKTDLLFLFLVLQYLYQNHTFYCMKRKRLWLFLLRDAMQAMLWKKWDFLDILDLMEETFFWCNISQAVTLGLLLFCLEFRPCTALQTFFWVSLHFLLVSSIFWEGVNFPLGFFQYYAQQRRLAFLLNISYWKPTSSYVVFAGKGYDLLAINTQRGRDHGLGGYNAYRSFFGLERISSMDQRPIEIAPDAWQAFQLVYRDPDDIDLFVGGLSETPMQGT